MERSETLGALAKALSAAQAEIEGAEKDRVNPAFRSKYADLAAVWDACKGALTRHGLSVSQVCEPSEPGTLRLTTMLLHESGEWLAGTSEMPLMKVDPQGYGSAMTYGRRYGLAAIVGVCPADEDDDGNAASGRSHAAPEPQRNGNGNRQEPRVNHPPRPASPRHEQAVRNAERPLDPEAAELHKQITALYREAGREAGAAAFWAWVSKCCNRPVTGWAGMEMADLRMLHRTISVEAAQARTEEHEGDLFAGDPGALAADEQPHGLAKS